MYFFFSFSYSESVALWCKNDKLNKQWQIFNSQFKGKSALSCIVETPNSAIRMARLPGADVRVLGWLLVILEQCYILHF